MALIVSSKTLPLEAFVALVLLDSSTDNIDVTSLSQKLIQLRRHGITFDLIDCRRAPRGYYSEDIDNYISYLLTFGYITERSPIKITKKGTEFLKKVIKKTLEMNPEGLNEVAKILNIDLRKII